VCSFQDAVDRSEGLGGLRERRQKIRDRECGERQVRVALDRDAAEAGPLELGERDECPLVAVRTARRDGEAEEDDVASPLLRFRCEKRVTAGG
jgi:hypothetical protein